LNADGHYWYIAPSWDIVDVSYARSEDDEHMFVIFNDEEHCCLNAGAVQGSALELSKESTAKAWPTLTNPILDPRVADLELRALSAAVR
jgi:hypothetical protein